MKMDLAGQKVAILGMARSGFAAARLCLTHGSIPICLDITRPAARAQEIAELETLGVRFHFGPHPLEALGGLDLIIKSPGVRSEIPLLDAARKRGITILGEVELASRFARGTILAITGTNGKSTTTAWAADMLTRCGIENELCGNIGRPLSDAVLKASPGAVLLTEVSSFQLEEIIDFRPGCAALLNLTPDHLDRHRDFDSYREAKLRLFENQTPDDHAVLGEEEDLAEAVRVRFGPRILRFRLEDRMEEGAFVQAGRIVLRWGGREEALCAAGEIALPGPHNCANALAALALTAPLRPAAAGLVASLTGFAGLPHRLERVGLIGGVMYVNDSKATNTDSLSTALSAFERPLLLLAGGRDKGQDFRPLVEKVRRRCRRVFLFGESAATIRDAWGANLCEVAGEMAEALDRARQAACPGDIVLLSPACASFDQFRDYEDRGDRFRRLVRDLSDRTVPRP